MPKNQTFSLLPLNQIRSDDDINFDSPSPFLSPSLDDPHSDQFDSNSTENSEKIPEHTQRKLKARHLSMIAIGGTIGTGLFLGSGAALSSGGPVGTLLGYLFMGLVIYCVTVSLGEMCAFLPVPGSFTDYAGRFIDPAVGFTLGWNYWYSYATTMPGEITAAAIVISYWNTGISVGFWITLFFFMTLVINNIGAEAYGEAEFWLSITKVITIVGLIILGFILVMGGGPNHDFVGFRYWRDPGPFKEYLTIGSLGRFLGFWAVFTQAAFSYAGTEIVAVAAGEAQNPTITIPKAIKKVFWRILLFYVLGILVIGLLVPSDDDELLSNLGGHTAAASPFVIAINRAGIKVLPDIINFVVLTSAFSAANSDLYAASRTLYALAMDGKAPAILKTCSKRGLPYYCVAASGIFGLLAYMNLSFAGSRIFEWFVSFAAVTGLFTWAVISLSYIRFFNALKRQGIDRNTLPYKSPFQPYAAMFSLFWCPVIILFSGFASFSPFNFAGFFASYAGIFINLGLYVGYKWWFKTKMVRLEDISFEMTRGYDRDVTCNSEPKSKFEKVLDTLL